jgi:uncharacterized membrane protein
MPIRGYHAAYLIHRSNSPRRFLGADETARVESAIAQAESNTSGQIRVVLARHCWLGLHRKAHHMFAQLGLHQTQHHNCVMILLVTTNHHFIVRGDQGIHQHVGAEFWHGVRDIMQGHFRKGEIVKGLCDGIAVIGENLSKHFPREGPGNELSNRIEYVA